MTENMKEYYIHGNRCDIVMGIVKTNDRAIVLGKNHIDGGLETTTFAIPIGLAEKLANNIDSPIGGTTMWEISKDLPATHD